MKISKEHRDALNEALDETAGYEGDVYVFDVKHVESLRSAVIAMLEDDEQIATVAPAVDARPVESEGVRHFNYLCSLLPEGFHWSDPLTPDVMNHIVSGASAQSEGLRKALTEIAEQERVELMLDPTWAQRVAIAALAQHTGEKS